MRFARAPLILARMTQAPENRNLGPQPLQALLTAHGLTAHELVAASPSPITHKLIQRAAKGRWLTPHSRSLVLTALNLAAHTSYTLAELFTYAGTEASANTAPTGQ